MGTHARIAPGSWWMIALLGVSAPGGPSLSLSERHGSWTNRAQRRPFVDPIRTREGRPTVLGDKATRETVIQAPITATPSGRGSIRV